MLIIFDNDNSGNNADSDNTDNTDDDNAEKLYCW